MKFKINLHFHTNDDPQDKGVNYTFFEGINRAKKLGFDVLALTCHKKYINTPEYEKYAEKNGILLIPGIELNVENCHVVVLNAKKDIETIKTFPELRRYKKEHPGAFIIAPHPFFYGNYSLKNELENNIDLFDAIEHSWFYSKRYNRNNKGEKIARKYNLPFIATSDTHDLWGLDKDYAIIESQEKTISAIFKSIQDKKFKNITSAKKFWREMVLRFGILSIRNLIKNLF